jgi:hypothetical protein
MDDHALITQKYGKKMHKKKRKVVLGIGTLIELSTTVTAPDRGRFISSYGEFAGTVYMDEFVVSSASATGGGSTTIVDRTPEEKEVIIGGQMENWIASVVGEGSASIHAWDVVVDPLNPDNPTDDSNGQNGLPGLWTHDLNRKPAYVGIVEGLQNF